MVYRILFIIDPALVNVFKNVFPPTKQFLSKLVDRLSDESNHLVRGHTSTVFLESQFVALLDQITAGITGQNRLMFLVRDRLASFVFVRQIQAPVVESGDSSCEQISLSTASPIAATAWSINFDHIFSVIDLIVRRLLHHHQIPSNLFCQSLKFVVTVANKSRQLHRIRSKNDSLIVLKKRNVLCNQEEAICINHQRYLNFLAAVNQLGHGVENILISSQA